MAVSQNVGNPSASSPSYISFGHIHKGSCVLLQEHLLKYVYYDFNNNSQKLETTWMSHNRMDKENLVYLQNELLLTC